MYLLLAVIVSSQVRMSVCKWVRQSVGSQRLSKIESAQFKASIYHKAWLYDTDVNISMNIVEECRY